MTRDTVLVGEVKAAVDKMQVTENCTAHCENKLMRD